MRKFKFTHHNGITSEVHARDLLDAVFSFRGNYHNLIKVEEIQMDAFLSQEKNMSNEEFEAHLNRINAKHHIDDLNPSQEDYGRSV